MSVPTATLVGQVEESASDGTIAIPNTTAPAVGDLLIMFIFCYASGGSRSLTTPSGWTLRASQDSAEEIGAIYTKVADSGDVSATDFSWSVSSPTTTDYIGGVIVKLSASTISTFVGASLSFYGSPADPDVFADTLSLTPTEPDNIIVTMFAGSDPSNGSATVASYTSTPSLSWSELADNGGANGGQGTAMAVAYATQTSETEITAVGATASSDRNDGHIIASIVVNGTTDADTTPTFVASTQSVFVPAGSAGANTTLGFVASTQSAFPPTGRGDTRPAFANETKNNASFNNETKPANASLTNETKNSVSFSNEQKT